MKRIALNSSKHYTKVAGIEAIGMRKQCKINNAIDMQKLDIQERNKYLKELKEGYNLSIRQLERLTGISRGIIQKV